MPVAVTMKGLLEPIELDEGFAETMQVLNNAAMQGKEFVVATGEDGTNVLLKMDNILIIRETDLINERGIG